MRLSPSFFSALAWWPWVVRVWLRRVKRPLPRIQGFGRAALGPNLNDSSLLLSESDGTAAPWQLDCNDRSDLNTTPCMHCNIIRSELRCVGTCKSIPQPRPDFRLAAGFDSNQFFSNRFPNFRRDLRVLGWALVSVGKFVGRPGILQMLQGRNTTRTRTFSDHCPTCFRSFQGNRPRAPEPPPNCWQLPLMVLRRIVGK